MTCWTRCFSGVVILFVLVAPGVSSSLTASRIAQTMLPPVMFTVMDYVPGSFKSFAVISLSGVLHPYGFGTANYRANEKTAPVARTNREKTG